MNTHLLDLLSLNWKVEFYTAQDLSIQVTATFQVPNHLITAEANMSAADVNDQMLQDFFWKKFFRVCMIKVAYYAGKEETS